MTENYCGSYLFTQVRDSIVVGSIEQLSALVKDHSDCILTLEYPNGLSAIHLAVIYKRIPIFELLLSLKHCNVNNRAQCGLTPLHFVLAKPKGFTQVNSYYKKLNIYPTIGEAKVIYSFVELFARSGAKLLRCEHNFSILSLALINKMHTLSKKLMRFFDLGVCHVFDYFNVKVYTSESKNLMTLSDVCEKRLVFLIKHGLSINYSLVEFDPDWAVLLNEIQTCFAVKTSLETLNGADYKLLCLHKSVDIRNENMFGEVAHQFIYGLSSIQTRLTKYLKIYEFSFISRSLFLYIILSLESNLFPRSFSLNSRRVSWDTEMNCDLWQFHCKLWQTALDHLNIIWTYDPNRFDITPVVHTLFKYFDQRLLKIFKPNYMFASDADIPARIAFNFLSVYTILFLYLTKRYSTYFSSSTDDNFYSYLQILLESSRSKAHLINLLVHPANYERTFKKFDVSIEDAISFLLHYNLDLNHRGFNGTTVLHEAVEHLSTPLPVINFLLNVGAYPFSLDSNGNRFYHYLDECVQTEVFKHPSLQLPFPLQTLCCLLVVSNRDLLCCCTTLLPPQVLSLLKLHTNFF